MNPTAFHEPFDAGVFDLTTAQTNKILVWNFDTPTYGLARAVGVLRDNVIQEYTVAAGNLILTTETGAYPNRVDLILNGADFLPHVNYDSPIEVRFFCSFLSAGDVEIEFTLRVFKSLINESPDT